MKGPLGIGRLPLAFFAAVSLGAGLSAPRAWAQAETRAQMTTPPPGSTLPGRTVTFAWSPGVGAGDYFLQISSSPYGQDIFYAIVQATSVTLSNLPTGGQSIYVALSTQVKGVWSPPLYYVYTAAYTVPPAPMPTTTSVDNGSVPYSAAAQSVPLRATAGGGLVNEGSFTFHVLAGASEVGAAVTSASPVNGSARVDYLLPAGTAPGTYTVRADFSGGPDFQPSTGTGTLAVNAPPPSGSAGLVPIVLDVASAAHYASELQLTNLGTAPAAVTLGYTGSIGAGSGGVTEIVPAGQQVVFADAISYLRSRGVPIPASGNQGGTLSVASASPGVRATVRTLADTAAPQPLGRAGLAYGDSAPAAFASASTLYVHGLRANDADRSNLAVYNMGPDPVSLRVSLFSAAGTGPFDPTAGQPISLPPWGWYQIADADLLRKAGFPSGYALVERVAGSGPFGAYGVVNDQVTNDGSFLPALPGAFAGTRLTVPVLVETGTFSSELVLTNRGTVPATFTLRYVESLSPDAGPGGTTTITLGPGHQAIVPEAIDFLRMSGLAIGARGSAGYAGSLRVEVAGVGLENAFAGARTSSLSPAGGEYGLFSPGIGSNQEFSDVAYVLGLKSDANNRSNVAVLATGPDGSGPVTLELQVLDGANGGLPAGPPFTATLNPGEWAQPPSFFAGSGVSNGYVRIRRTAGTAPWYAYGVVNDGGLPGQRTGDGSYIPAVAP